VNGASATALLNGQSWNSSGPAPKYVVIDLGVNHLVDGIQLAVEQSPAGATVHQIFFTAALPARILTTAPVFIWNGPSYDGQIITFSSATSFTARYFAVYTTASPSWVAWYWIKVFGTPV